MPRRRAWADFFVSMLLVDAVPQSVDLLTQAPDLDTITVARLVGRLHAQHAGLTTQVDSRMAINIGIGVASVEAFGVAASAGLPIVGSAASQPPRGWLYRTQMLSTKVHSTGTTYEINEPDMVDFDIRSLRKVDQGRLFLVAESLDIDFTAADIRLTGLIRALCLT